MPIPEGNDRLPEKERTMKRILLTSERHRNSINVVVDGVAIALTVNQYCCLVRLVIARGRGHSGFVCDSEFLYPKAIFTLRRALDLAGAGTGMQLIENGPTRKYALNDRRLPECRLTISSKDHVALGEGMQELVDAGILMEDELEHLRAICQAKVIA